ncbi:uncharacterized protein LOC143291962 [Babylonia areolata]|uniref:uncharacterized protein LOC143291962 n=1 Tax=Babylonia areolata TaxID=304850 RepID=UPI003FD169C7
MVVLSLLLLFKNCGQIHRFIARDPLTPFLSIMKPDQSSSFTAPCTVYTWGVVTAMIIMSTGQSEGMIQRGSLTNDTDINGDSAWQAERHGTQLTSVKIHRREFKPSSKMPSFDDYDSKVPNSKLLNSEENVNNNDTSDASDGKIHGEDETRQDDVLLDSGDGETYDFQENEDPMDMTYSYIRAAVSKGIHAQYELCDRFCDGNSTFVNNVRNDHCYYEDTECQRCFCDHACVHYGDCCPLMGSSSLPQIGTRENMCLEVNTGYWTQFVEVIASCPEKYSDSDQGVTHNEDCNACEVNGTNDLSKLVVSMDTYVLYCNSHCAACNGETTFSAAMVVECETDYEDVYYDYHSYYYDTSSSQDMDRDELSSNNTDKPNETVEVQTSDVGRTTGFPMNTEPTSLPPSHNVSQCKLVIPREHTYHLRTHFCRKKATLPTQLESHGNHTVVSNATELDIMDDLCRQYSYPIVIGNRVYRNLFCALLDGIVPGQKECHEPSFDMAERTLFVLTDLRPPEVVYRTPPVPAVQCVGDDDGWYDVASDTCRPVSCEEGREWLGGHPYCTPIMPTNMSVVYTYNIYVIFQPGVNSTHFSCADQWAFVHDTVISHLAGIMQQLNITFYAIRTQCSDNYFVHPSKIFVHVKFVTPAQDGESQADFEMKLVDYFAVPHRSLSAKNNVTSVELHMTFTSGFFNWDVQHTVIPYSNGSCCEKTQFNDINLLSQYRFLTEDLNSHHVAIVFGPFTPYALVLLNVTEYDRVTEDRYNLTFVNISLDAWDVQETRDGLAVPFLFLQNAYIEAGLVQDPQPQIEIRYRFQGLELQILSSCCLIVSIVSLTFLLATYSVFPELRTLPGINTMFLAAWLLLAQLLLLTAPSRTEVAGVCQALAMVLHYSWLCVVTWCSVCSFHMYDVFVRQQVRMHMPHRHTWYLKRYVALAHSLPAIVVLLVVVSTTVWTSGEDLGYGGHICYLNRVLLVGLAFVLPLALSVLSNLVLLVLTARAVSRVKRQKVSGTRAERGSIKIYIGLSSLTGLCWLVALMAEIPGCGWLQYVSAVLNGLQGLHLAVSYAGSKRVMRMWQHKLRCKTSRSQQSTSSSTSQTRRTFLSSV